MEFVANGAKEQTDCWFEVQEYPHTFTSQLKAKNCVEHDDVTFEIDTEASDAEVNWYLGNKKLVPDGTSIVVTAVGTKRTLTIHDAALKQCGEINARTNKDRSAAPLHVGVLNEIVKHVTSDAFR